MNNTKTLVIATVFAAFSVGATAAPLASRQTPTAAVASMVAPATTKPFKGAEVNGGTATLSGRTVKLSADFKIPKAPAPTWQIVDKAGNVYLLKQINIVGGKTNRQVELPSYIKSVAKVQIWCSFAEVLLGEASFAQPVDLR